jgi:hypothetical protein
VLRNLLKASTLLIAVISFLNWGCTKIDTTTLGSDLIPVVDNVNTFADTLDISSAQGIFDDTSRVPYSDLHVLGSITNDPLFGRTYADMYLQLKPIFFPYTFGNAGDTITHFDSAVLCLSYNSFYGDTLMPQTFTVYEIDAATTNFKDSSYKLDFLPNLPTVNQLGSITIKPTDVKNFTYFKGRTKDSINYQIRIPLSDDFLREKLIINLDTSASSRGIYRSDSLFKDKMKGLAVKSSGAMANGLFYIDLTNAATRLEIHYRKTNRGIIDTSYSTLAFSTGVSSTRSAQATNLVRERNGFPVSTPSSDIVYIQTQPGTYATLNIPRLTTYSNRIVHRAEIYMEQVPTANPVDNALLPPSFLYLDLVDTPATANKFKPVYFDLSPDAFYNPDDSIYFFPSNGIDFSYFGGYLRRKTVGANSLFYYTFNVTRHVQHIVTNQLYNYPFRLYAPKRIRYGNTLISHRNELADGRIQLGGGTNANYKMYMRVVYSRL